jgi:hypothetical protein
MGLTACGRGCPGEPAKPIFWRTADEEKTIGRRPSGEAITYMRKHWDKLTLFLRHPAVPLDKNYASYCTSLSGSQAIS